MAEKYVPIHCGNCNECAACGANNREIITELEKDIAEAKEANRQGLALYETMIKGWDNLAGLMARLQKLVDEQAEDEGLWFTSSGNLEVEYIQAALRKLHAIIEGPYDPEIPPVAPPP